MRSAVRWIPGFTLALGALLNTTLVSRRSGPVELVGDLQSVAVTELGVKGEPMVVSEDEQRVAGFTDYMMRNFTLPDGREFSVYVGYYDEQHQGKSIHSPRNCLPGAGWEPVGRTEPVVTSERFGPVAINRYELVKEQSRALVYYWYQGRGRVAHDEYRVKYQLLRDAALLGRTEEALVRIVVPVVGDNTAAADSLALPLAGRLIDDVERVLPPR